METTTSPIDEVAILDIARKEFERQNKYFEFAQQQIDKDRSFYKHLYSVCGAVLAIIVAAAAYGQYSSVSQMRADMKAAVDAELERDKRVIASLTEEGKQSITDARNKTTN